MRTSNVGGITLKIKFLNVNRNVLFNSYLPEIIAESLFQRIKRKEVQSNEDTIYRSKPVGEYGRSIGENCSTGDVESIT